MKRIMSGFAVLALALGGLVAFGVSSAGAAASLTITPNTGLTSDQEVVITGAGFPASTGLYAVECVATATTEAGCDISTATPVTSNADGTLPSTNFFVQVGTIGSGTCGTTSTDATCAIAVGTSTGLLYADATITFASGSTTTTTTAPTTTTTAPTTTTTKPPKPSPRATKVSGQAIPGRTVVLTISGAHFTGKPRITAHAGTTVTVTGVSSSRIKVRVKEAATGKKGTYSFVLHFSGGKTTSVHYRVK